MVRSCNSCIQRWNTSTCSMARAGSVSSSACTASMRAPGTIRSQVASPHARYGAASPNPTRTSRRGRARCVEDTRGAGITLAADGVAGIGGRNVLFLEVGAHRRVGIGGLPCGGFEQRAQRVVPDASRVVRVDQGREERERAGVPAPHTAQASGSRATAKSAAECRNGSSRPSGMAVRCPRSSKRGTVWRTR